MLVVFDIDGTVTRTNSLDRELFARAFNEVYGGRLDTDWNRYKHVTDQGVIEEALSGRLGRPVTAAETSLLRERFITLLRSALVHSHETMEVPGACEAIRRLSEGGDLVGFATGCWEPSARLKLACVGLDIGGFSVATSDDSSDRLEILRLAIERSKAFAPVKGAVYVGDGPWDLEASRRLGVPFIGIDHARSGCLAALGVKHVLPNFLDYEGFVDAIKKVI